MLERLTRFRALAIVALTSAFGACDDDANDVAGSGGVRTDSFGGASASVGGKQAIAGAASGGNDVGGVPNGDGGALAGGRSEVGGTAGGSSAEAGTGGSAGSTETGGANDGGAPNVACALDPSGIGVTSAWDELGYPSYAVDGCRLVYVASDGSLRLRLLDDGSEVELESAATRPRRPTLKGSALAWEASVDAKSTVRVYSSSGVVTLSGGFDHAGEPAASEGAVAFTAFMATAPTADTDVFVYDIENRTLSSVFTGPGQQRFPAISLGLVAASDFSEDPRGYFDETGSLSDIIVRSRDGGDPVTRSRPGKQAFPMLSDDGTLAYLEWGAVHPEPKFSAFSLYIARSGTPATEDVKLHAIETEPSYVRPSLGNGFVDFIDRSSGKPLLHRKSLEGAETNAPVEFAASSVPLGPVARQAFTLLATRNVEGARLQVVAR